MHTNQKITEVLHPFCHIFYHFHGWHVDADLYKNKRGLILLETNFRLRLPVSAQCTYSENFQKKHPHYFQSLLLGRYYYNYYDYLLLLLLL